MCEYTVIAELDMYDSISADVLSAGPSVVTGFTPTERPADYFSKPLEVIFHEFSADDIDRVMAHFSEQSTEFVYYAHDVRDFKAADSLLAVLLTDFTFTEIRDNLRKLFA